MKNVIGLILAAALGMELAAAADGTGYVVIYRQRRYVGSALEPPVFVDGRMVAKADNGRYFTVALNPGTHQITSNDRQSGIDVKLQAGQVRYVQVDIAPGAMKGHGKLILMSDEQGPFEAGKLKAVDAGKVKEPGMVLYELPAPAGGAAVAPSAVAPILAATPAAAPVAVVDPPPPPPPPVDPKNAPLDVQAILQMKEGGLSDDLILSMAGKRGVAAIEPAELIKLKTAGVSESALAKLVGFIRN